MKPEIQASLEEIEAGQDLLLKATGKTATYIRAAIRRHKELLHQLGYQGKMPRKRRQSK